MLRRCLLRIIQFIEHIRDNGWSRVLHDTVFFNRKAIVIEKDLGKGTFTAELFSKLNVEFIELTSALISEGKFRYALKNRHLKALIYFENGYGGHAVAREGKILGDIWHYPKTPSDNATAHCDLSWLGISLGNGDVYSFDTYMVADARGGNLSAALDRSSMHALRLKGFKKAYAYYWADNTAAVWNQRVLYKCTELKTLKVHSILLHRKVVGEVILASK